MWKTIRVFDDIEKVDEIFASEKRKVIKWQAVYNHKKEQIVFVVEFENL